MEKKTYNGRPNRETRLVSVYFDPQTNEDLLRIKDYIDTLNDEIKDDFIKDYIDFSLIDRQAIKRSVQLDLESNSKL